MVEAFPNSAISVRQPWAWALIHGGKDIENRPLFAPWGPLVGARVAIHASKGMTRAEYDEAAAFMAVQGVTCPPAADLVRGAIIGSVRVMEIVATHRSAWFFGPAGIVVGHAAALAEPIPCRGALGVFAWRNRAGGEAETPKRWMVKR